MASCANNDNDGNDKGDDDDHNNHDNAEGGDDDDDTIVLGLSHLARHVQFSLILVQALSLPGHSQNFICLSSFPMYDNM